jgi:hypothetical protein
VCVCVTFLIPSFILSFLLAGLLSSHYFVLSFSPLCLIHLIGLDILCFYRVRCSWEHLNLPHSIALDASALRNCTGCCLAKIHNKGSSFNTRKRQNVGFQEKISVTGIRENLLYEQ